MSQYILEDDKVRWVFGWDQPLMSFFLQKHDKAIEDPDDNPVVWIGATELTRMCEVDALVRAAKRHDLIIPYAMQVALFRDQDEGR